MTKIAFGIVSKELSVRVDNIPVILQMAKKYDMVFVSSARDGITHGRTLVLHRANATGADVLWMIDSDVAVYLTPEDVDAILDKVINERAVVVNPAPNNRMSFYVDFVNQPEKIELRKFYEVKSTGFWSVWMPLPLDYTFRSDAERNGDEIVMLGEDVMFFRDFRGKKYVYFVPSRHMKYFDLYYDGELQLQRIM